MASSLESWQSHARGCHQGAAHGEGGDGKPVSCGIFKSGNQGYSLSWDESARKAMKQAGGRLFCADCGGATGKGSASPPPFTGANEDGISVVVRALEATVPPGSPRPRTTTTSSADPNLHRGGGCVFNTIHNVAANAPTENLIAMYETVYGGRGYSHAS